MALGLPDQRLDERTDLRGQRAGLAPQEHPHQGGDLVVAGPAGPQPPAEFVTHPLDQPAFQRGVDVLVRGHSRERAAGHVGGECVQAGDETGQFGVVEQPGRVQRPGVRLRTGQVVGRQPPVEVGRARQRDQRRRRAAVEAAAPQLRPVAVGISQRRTPWPRCPARSRR